MASESKLEYPKIWDIFEGYDGKISTERICRVERSCYVQYRLVEISGAVMEKYPFWYIMKKNYEVDSSKNVITKEDMNKQFNQESFRNQIGEWLLEKIRVFMFTDCGLKETFNLEIYEPDNVKTEIYILNRVRDNNSKYYHLKPVQLK